MMADEPETPAWLRLPNGSTWPRPALESDEYSGPAWRARYTPDSLTRGDLLYLASVAEAYGALIDTPVHARKLPAIRQALRDEEKR